MGMVCPGPPVPTTDTPPPTCSYCGELVPKAYGRCGSCGAPIRPRKLSDDEVARIREAWSRAYAGPLVLPPNREVPDVRFDWVIFVLWATLVVAGLGGVFAIVTIARG